MNNHFKNEEGGFLKLIIFIIAALLILNYFKISLSDVFSWLKALINSVF